MFTVSLSLVIIIIFFIFTGLPMWGKYVYPTHCPLSSSHTFTILAPVELWFTPNKIRVNQNGKEENPASIQCPTMLLRCLQDSSTARLRLMPAALRFTPMELRMLKNAHDAAMIRYGATTV